jgi:hypothetical protein
MLLLFKEKIHFHFGEVILKDSLNDIAISIVNIDFRLPTSDSRLPTSYSLLPTPYFRLPTISYSPT